MGKSVPTERQKVVVDAMGWSGPPRDPSPEGAWDVWNISAENKKAGTESLLVLRRRKQRTQST
jgi:hypothetical protein